MDELKAEEEQMELMTMMMMQQQLPQYHMEEFHPPLDSNTTMPLADLIDNNPLPTSIPCSSFTHLPSTISFSNTNPIMLQQQQTSTHEDENSMAAMRDMIFRMAAMQPIHIDPESVKAPKRRNVKISKDPQSVAARHRRERISERIRILQRLVPGGTKMDTASMLDEAIHYVKFLKTQLHSLQRASNASQTTHFPIPMPMSMSSTSNSTPYVPMPHPRNTQMHHTHTYH